MPEFKPTLTLKFVLAIAVVTVAAQLWFLQRQYGLTQSARTEIHQKEQEVEALRRRTPTLNVENEAALAADLADKILRLETFRAKFAERTGQDSGAKADVTSLQLYFDLSEFVRQARLRAAREKVDLRPDEYFGFKSHSQAGPESDLVSLVAGQHRRVQFLWDTLLAAHPHALLSVQREHPRVLMQGSGGASSPSNQSGSLHHGEAEDFFEWTSPLSLRVGDRLDGEAFRLEFVGYTETLREFVLRLASGSPPCFVRSVEVTPMSASPVGKKSKESAGAREFFPVVPKSDSRFTIVVEFVTAPVPPRL